MVTKRHPFILSMYLNTWRRDPSEGVYSETKYKIRSYPDIDRRRDRTVYCAILSRKRSIIPGGIAMSSTAEYDEKREEYIHDILPINVDMQKETAYQLKRIADALEEGIVTWKPSI